MIRGPEAYSSEQISEIPQHVQLFVFCVQTILIMTAPLPYPQAGLKEIRRSHGGLKEGLQGEGRRSQKSENSERKHEFSSALHTLARAVKADTQTPAHL